MDIKAIWSKWERTVYICIAAFATLAVLIWIVFHGYNPYLFILTLALWTLAMIALWPVIQGKKFDREEAAKSLKSSWKPIAALALTVMFFYWITSPRPAPQVVQTAPSPVQTTGTVSQNCVGFLVNNSCTGNSTLADTQCSGNWRTVWLTHTTQSLHNQNLCTICWEVQSGFVDLYGPDGFIATAGVRSRITTGAITGVRMSNRSSYQAVFRYRFGPC